MSPQEKKAQKKVLLNSTKKAACIRKNGSTVKNNKIIKSFSHVETTSIPFKIFYGKTMSYIYNSGFLFYCEEKKLKAFSHCNEI